MNVKSVIMAAAMVLSFGAFAGDTGASAVFKKLDKNSDGAVSKQEATGNKNLIRDWKTIDKNANDKIEMAEFSALESAEAYTPVEEENEPIGAAPTQ